MNIKTSRTNPAQNDSTQNDPMGIIVPQDQDGTELYDSHTPDSYDAHIIPAETAARKEHEGASFKHLAKHPVGPNSIDTTGGFTVDKEGLLDNFAIEPEMYYQTRGDLPDKVRQEEARQEAIRQEEARQEEVHQEEARQEAIHQEEIRQDKARQEAIHQEEVRQDKARQEEVRQEEARQEEIRQDKARQEAIHQEEVRQDKARQEAIRQEEVRQDKARQEAIHQEEVRQDKARQEAISQGLKQFGVGTFSSYEVTEIALSELKNTGFLMDRVSLVGRDINSHTEVTGSHISKRLADVGNLHTNENKAEETAKEGAVAGSTVGGLTGLLVGLGLIAIPGVGPVMLAGAAATAIATAVSGGVIGAAAGSLAGGLVGLGIHEDRAKIYSDRISRGDYLVMVEGSEADIAQAESIFSNRGIHDWHIYDLSDDSVRTVTVS